MNNVEQSVLQMRFDNAQFERGIKQSINSLDNFNKSADNVIKKNGLSQGLKNIATAAANLSFKGITKGVDEVQQKFSFLDVFAVNVFSRISNSVLNTANSFGRLVTGIDAAQEGLNKYGTKMTAVKTITTATGESVDSVNKTLEDLNWFTDETSYEFDQMVSTMGKFTSAGETLQDSKKEVEGIALWAARSGQNAQIASRVMYQLSQAYGRGYIMAQDWMSVEQANMSTQEIQNKLIEAGGQAAKDAIKANGGFRDSLKDQWLTTKVLNQVLEEYSEGVTQANWNNHEFTGGVTDFSKQAFLAAQEARTLTDVVNALKDVVSTGWMNTFETIFGGQEESTKFFTDLSNNLIDLSYLFIDSRQAAVEAWRAFGGRDQMIEGSNGIFSNLTKTIKLIGSNIIPKKSRDEQLRDLKGLSKEGDELIDKIEKFRSGAGIGLDESNKQLAEMYSQLDKLDKAAPLLRITNGIKKFTDGISNAFYQYEKYEKIPNKDSMSDLGLVSIMGSEDDIKVAKRMEKLVDVVQGVGHAFSILKSMVTGFFDAIKPLLAPLEEVGDALLDVFDSIGRLVGQTDETTRSGNTFYDLFKKIIDFILPPFTKACDLAAKGLEWLSDKIDQVSSAIKDSGLGGFFDGIKSFVSDVGGGIGDFFKTMGDAFKSGGGILGVLKQLGSFGWQGLGKGLGLVGKGLKWLTGDSSVVGSLGKILNLSMAAGGLAGVINLVKGLVNLKNITGLIKKGASGEGGIFGSIATAFFGRKGAAPSILEPFKQLVDSLIGDNGLIDKLKKLVDKGKFTAMTLGLRNIGAAFLEIAGAFLLISVALRILSGADPKKLSENSKWLLLSIGEIAGLLAVFSGKFKHLKFSGFKAIGFGTAFMEVANAMLVVAIALRILSGADPDTLATNSSYLLWSMAAIGGMLAALSLKAGKWKFSSLKGIGFGFAFEEVANAMLVVAIALRILSGADPKQLSENSKWLLISFGVIGGMLAALSLKAGKWKFSSLKAIGFGFAFQEVASAMLMVALSLKMLDGMTPEELKDNATALLSVLGAIAVALGILATVISKQNFGALNVVAIGLAFQQVGSTMMMIASSLKMLDGMTSEELEDNATALISTLGAIAVALGGLATVISGQNFGAVNIMAAGFAMVEVAKACQMIGDALQGLAQYDWDQIAGALGGLGIALGAFAGVAGIIVATGSAGGMAVAAGVLVLLAGSFWIFSQAIQNAANGIATLASSADAIVDAVGKLASIEEETGQADEMLAALGSAYEAFGTAIMNAGLFAEGKANAIVSLVNSTDQLVESVQKLVAIPADQAESALETLGDGYKGFADALKQAGFFGLNASVKGEALSEMADSTLNLANAISRISTISDYGQGAFNAITDYFTALNDLDVSTSVNKLSQASDSINNFVATANGASTGLNAMTTSFSTLISTISSMDVSKLHNLGANMATSINDGFNDSSKAILNSVTAMMDGVKMGISNHSSDVSNAARDVSIAGGNAAAGQYYLFSQAGKNFGDGIVIGMQSRRASVVAAAYSLGKAAADAYARAQDSHSPSKVGIKLGGYFPEGIAIGMKRMGYLVTNAAKDLSTNVVGSIGYNVTTTGYSPTMNYGDGVRYGLDLAHIRSAGYSKPTQEPIIVQAAGGQVLGDNAEYTINIPLTLNGRQIAKATARYSRDELNRMDRFDARKKGEY